MHQGIERGPPWWEPSDLTTMPSLHLASYYLTVWAKIANRHEFLEAWFVLSCVKYLKSVQISIPLKQMVSSHHVLKPFGTLRRIPFIVRAILAKIIY